MEYGKWRELPEANGNISNCDFSIDDGVEAELLSGHYCNYFGWYFCGYVWHDGRFNCEVWQYRSPVDIISAETLDDIMHLVSDEYGYA